MLLNHHYLIRLCEAVLNDEVGESNFGELLAEAGVKLDEDEKEWDIANNLLKKSAMISHAAGGLEKKTIH